MTDKLLGLLVWNTKKGFRCRLKLRLSTQRACKAMCLGEITREEGMKIETCTVSTGGDCVRASEITQYKHGCLVSGWHEFMKNVARRTFSLKDLFM